MREEFVAFIFLNYDTCFNQSNILKAKAAGIASGFYIY
jgi:hypothetical protein